MFLDKLKDCLTPELLAKSISDSLTIKKSVMKRGKSELSGFFGGQNNLHSTAKMKKLCPEKLTDKDNSPKNNDGFSFQFSF